MQFIYKPEGADPRSWDFDPARLMSPEVEVIERKTGYAFGEWVEAVGKGSFLAIHGLLYVLLKRQHPTLQWDEVQFCMEDIDFHYTPDEKRKMLEDLETKAAAGRLDDDDAIVLQELRDDPDLATTPEEDPLPLES